jgi:hypothetical protein
MPRRTAHVAGVRPWTRARMRALVLVSAVLVLVVVSGLAVAVFSAFRPGTLSGKPAPAGATAEADPPGRLPSLANEQVERDELAAASMPQVDQDAARPSAVSLRDPGTLLIPAPTGTGVAGVPTGFPRTPTGALAQLAAIDQTAMQSGSLAGARAVITGWALPGGPTGQSWSGVAAMAGFLDAAGLSGGGSGQLAIAVTPLMGLIKGHVGDDFVIPCVDFEVDVTLAQTARGAAADCARMVWTGDRWMIGPGAEPATPPSVWPDTDAAIRVGYRDLRTARAGQLTSGGGRG